MAEFVRNDIKRIDQLDGLRGLAIILVILNHLRLTPLYDLFPQVFHPLLSSVLNSGKVGVSILFLMSGFLMATLYPQVTSKMSFWQKRYTRIFPAFVSMCLALAIIRFYWNELSPLAILGIVTGVALTGGIFWQGIIRLRSRVTVGKLIFFLFLTVQLFTIFGYLVILPRISSSVFYILWPKWAQQIVVFFINSTAALPFGNFVAPLDGAYWSIITEVLFYILYPLIFLPIIHLVVTKKSVLFGLLCMVMSLPFFYGLWILFGSILMFQTIQIHLAVYFAFGVAIGYIRQNPWVNNLQNNSKRFPALLLIALCLFITMGMPLVRQILHWPDIVDMLFWAIPLSLVLIVTVSEQNSWINFLRHPILMKIGTLSYALYLTHTIAIEMFLKSGDPQTVKDMVVAGLLSIGVMSLLSITIHVLLELPYFNKKIISDSSNKQSVVKRTRMLNPLWTGIAGFLFLIWFAYRVPVTLASRVVNHYVSLPQISAFSSQPLEFQFTGQHNNLGMLMFYIKPLTNSELESLHVLRGANGEGSLIVEIRDETGKQHGANSYALSQIYDSKYFTAGLPLDPQSAGKQFTVGLYHSSANTAQIMGLINSDVSFRSVYFYDKKELLKHPDILLSILVEKLTQPFFGKEVQKVFMFSGPLIGLLFIRSLFSKTIHEPS